MKFTFNWNNKLFCKYFTSIRPYFKDRFNQGEIVKVIYSYRSKNFVIGQCKIVYSANVLFNEIPEILWIIETGYSEETSIKIFKQIYANSNINYDKQLFQLMWLCNLDFKKFTDKLNEFVLTEFNYNPETQNYFI